jgi:glycosyltransferase involved in cell wall biosynthesis
LANIAIITSDYPDFISGIGDYAYKLRNYLSDHNRKTYVISSNFELINKNTTSLVVNWKISEIPKILNFIKQKCISCIIIQYPGLLYGKFNIVIHLLCIIIRMKRICVITTLHEFNNVHFLRRLSELIFVLASHLIVFTTDSEASNPIINILFKQKVRIIPIFPNINFPSNSAKQDSSIILHFGMIYPDREIMKVINKMGLIDRWRPERYVFKFIGGRHFREKDYYEKMFKASKDILERVYWSTDLPLEEIAQQIESVFIAIVFYNDGLSLRRGSALTLMKAGIPIITNKGGGAEDFKEVENTGVFYYTSDDELKNLIEKLKTDDKYYYDCSISLQKFSEKFNIERVVESYDSIMNEFIERSNST